MKISPALAKRTNKQIETSCQMNFQELYVRASDGDHEAFAAYFDALIWAVSYFDGLLGMNPEVSKALARKRRGLPVLLTNHPQTLKGLWLHQSQLELGEDTPFKKPSPKKPWSEATPAIVVVREYLFWMTQMRVTAQAHSALADLDGYRSLVKLPPLTGKSAHRWFVEMWDVIAKDAGGRPEKVDRLRKLGVHKINHQREMRTPRSAAEIGEKHVRAGIRESLRLAFLRIVKSAT